MLANPATPQLGFDAALAVHIHGPHSGGRSLIDHGITGFELANLLPAPVDRPKVALRFIGTDHDKPTIAQTNQNGIARSE